MAAYPTSVFAHKSADSTTVCFESFPYRTGPVLGLHFSDYRVYQELATERLVACLERVHKADFRELRQCCAPKPKAIHPKPSVNGNLLLPVTSLANHSGGRCFDRSDQ